MGDLTFQYPAWYLVLCVLFASLVTGILYMRDKRFQDHPAALRAVLVSLRFIAVFLISALLLEPLVNSMLSKTKDPIIVFAQDASTSVTKTMDEGRFEAYKQSIETMLTDLEGDYQVDRYAFANTLSEGVDTGFAGEVTNLSAALDEIYDLYSNQNVGAVILASDGIFNRGSHPLYTSKQLAAPLYTIGLGDTLEKRDLNLRRVFNNRIAYLGDRFAVEIDVQALNCQGEATVLTVQRVSQGNVQTLERIPLDIDEEAYFQTRELILDADEPGMQRYRISLSALNDEASTENNTRDIFIDVLDARQKIVILAASPHPDLTALKQAISSNRNYEVTISMVSEFEGEPESYDLAILHQIPTSATPWKPVFERLDRLNVPRWHILGMQSDFAALNSLQNLLNTTVDGRNTNDVRAAIAPDFSLFTLEEELSVQLPGFAPLVSAFGDFKAGPAAKVMLWQRIGKIDTNYPLLLFGEENGIRTAILTAEGLWKWRLYDYLKNANHDLFDGLIGKTVQYLSVKEDKRRFRVEAATNIFPENEPVVVNAELYNASYELINDPDATLTITNEQGEAFDVAFSRRGKGYSVNAGFFPAGNYTYTAEVMAGEGRLTASGQFSVEPIQLEAYQTTAMHGLLRQLSARTGGNFFAPEEIPELNQTLQELGIRPVVYQTEQTIPLTHFKWVFGILFFLLALEWFLRRYFGAY